MRVGQRIGTKPRRKMERCLARTSVGYSGVMERAAEPTLGRERGGLCADCAHALAIESDRGSAFLLCQLSRSDPRLAKYPRLPVLSCPGYEKRREQADRP